MLNVTGLLVEIFAPTRKQIVARVADSGSTRVSNTAGINDAGYTVYVQPRARCNNSFSAPAAAKMGQAEMATIMAKRSASMANSKLLSLAK
ncbi:MAG: hypothetical protein DME76_14975 [Verrucomicrobia bacterium]|nr:MAG: hypothetical protein DME76_14975 [Verrucomicrobiota bacterium]